MKHLIVDLWMVVALFTIVGASMLGAKFFGPFGFPIHHAVGFLLAAFIFAVVATVATIVYRKDRT